VPYETVIAWLRARPHLVVGDFGCGEAQLAASVPNTVYSFDHVAINEAVTACDMAHTPLEDGMLDVAVFSLSLMVVVRRRLTVVKLQASIRYVGVLQSVQVGTPHRYGTAGARDVLERPWTTRIWSGAAVVAGDGRALAATS
jgi:hypothetical protein